MGVGTPSNLIECVWRGIDLFDCVMPSRNARHGHLFTWQGVINLNNARYKTDGAPIESMRLPGLPAAFARLSVPSAARKGDVGHAPSVMHNLYFYNTLMECIRGALDCGKFSSFREEYSQVLSRRI
jgi:queuine tRNA-ribosyltransferase